MPLSDIVNVQITRQTQTISEENFGNLMILGTFKNWNDLIRQYNSIQAVGEDFNPYQPEYIAAQDVFSQVVTPPFIYIGRRTVDTIGIEVETAMPGQTYSATIQNYNAITPTVVTINSTPIVQQSVVTLSGIVTWVITFSTDFNSDTTAITPTINGVTLASTAWTTDQATTIDAVATVIAAASGVTSATASGDVITVVFTASTSAIVNSVTVVGTGSQPTVSLTQNGPLVASNVITFHINGVSQTPITYASSSSATMNAIASAIQTYLNSAQSTYSPGVAVATVSGPNNNILSIVGNPNQSAVVNSFVVTMGASQATAAIVNSTQLTTKNTIADALSTAINAADLGLVSTVPSVPDGTLSVTTSTPGNPYTFSVFTNIGRNSAIQYRVEITQAVPSQGYKVLINRIPFIYEAPYNVSTNAQIVAGLVALINSTTVVYPNNPVPQPNPIYGIVTATDNTNGTFELTAATAFEVQAFPFEYFTIQWGLIIAPYTPSASVVTDLQAIQSVNNSWYALACTDRTVATIQAIATWVETQTLIFGTASNDLNIINEAPGTDITSIAYWMQNQGLARSFCMYHQDAAIDYPECAWFGAVLPQTPGSETWAFKALATIPYSILSYNQQQNCFGKNANLYQYVGGVGITQNGTVAVGEYIDIIRGVDWLTSTIQTYVYSVLVNLPKIPYTDKGITCIEAQIMRALDQGVTNNFIASSPAYIVNVPLAINCSPTDKANRVLNNVNFTATLAGAIQAINIKGTVSV